MKPLALLIIISFFSMSISAQIMTIQLKNGQNIDYKISDIVKITYSNEASIADVTINIPGLVGYFPFNGDATNQITGAKEGQVYGAKLSSDRFGNLNSAYKFSSRQDQIIFSNYKILNVGNADYTINGWFKVEDPSGTEQMILQGLGPNGNQTAIAICTNYAGGGNKLTYFLGPNWAIARDSRGSLSPEFYKWHMFTLIKNGNTYSNYIDGQLDKKHFSNSTLNQLWIGFKIGSFDPNEQNPHSFKGSLDDYSFFNRALSENEIMKLYQTKVR